MHRRRSSGVLALSTPLFTSDAVRTFSTVSSVSLISVGKDVDDSLLDLSNMRSVPPRSCTVSCLEAAVQVELVFRLAVNEDSPAKWSPMPPSLWLS